MSMRIAVFAWVALLLGLTGVPSPAREAPTAPADPDAPPIVEDAEALLEGKSTYSIHCSRCHGLTGMGVTATGGGGPSLVDEKWLHGSSYNEMLYTVIVGVPGTIMKSWLTTLGAERVRQVVAYVYRFRFGETPGY